MLARLKFDIADLVNEILDQIPQDDLIHGRVLDLSIGGGQFVREIERRKRAAGLSDQEIRDSVYGFEGNIIRVNYAVNKHKLIGTYRVNAILGEDLGDMRFDVIVGNPPYAKPDKSGRDDDNLWPLFLEIAHGKVEPGGWIGFVTPASWGSLGTNVAEPGSAVRKKLFSPYQVSWVDLTASRHFPDIGSTFSSYVMRSSPYDHDELTEIRFSDKVVNSDFNSYLCFPLKHSEAEFSEIIKSFAKRTPYPVTLSDPYPKARYSMKKKLSEGTFSHTRSTTHPHRSYHTNAQTHLYSSYRNDFHDQWKVVFSYSGTWKTEVTDDCSLTDASMCVICDDQQQALSVQSVLDSSPIKFLINDVYRWSGYYSGAFLQMIPALPMDHIYSEDEVYDQLFTSEQAQLIRSKLDSKNKSSKIK